MLSQHQLEQFQHDGFLILRQRVTPSVCAAMREVVTQQLQEAAEPVEYEAEVGYRGAPASLNAPGGRTIRRLRGAWGRHICFRDWAADADLIATLQQLLKQPVVLNLAHHNCVMTKHPQWSSATGWHRDIRYWSFARADLITVWLALGDENADNGALQVLPGSHRWQLAPEQFDERDFLRTDLPQNQPLLAQGVTLALDAGDVLLFHSSLLHAAGNNRSGARKLSLVFAWRGADNAPLPGTRSAAAGEIVFP
jgi:phytanoyl-CoA hydroxylase